MCAARAISINWDLWNETGMATRKQVPKQLREAYEAELKYGIKTQQGVEAFFRILRSGFSQILVSMRASSKSGSDNIMDADIEHESSVQQQGIRPASEEAAAPAPTRTRRYPRPDLQEAYIAPSSELEKNNAEMWAEALSLETVGINDDFFELGGHSLLALQMLPRLRHRFQIELSPREFFSASTVSTVSQVVEEKL
jgi:acyl carrier protein